MAFALQSNKRMRFYIALFLSLYVNAAHAGLFSACAEALGIQAPSRSSSRQGPAPLTAKQAFKITGDGPTRAMFQNAMGYVSGHEYTDRNVLMQDLDKLFSAIHYVHEDWMFEKFNSADRASTGYVGSNGHFIVLQTDGRLYLGKMDKNRDLNEYDEWLGTYTELKPLIAPDRLPVANGQGKNE